jgi:hypothetical protein
MKTLLLALLLFIFPVLAWSHPGKTDSVGGHKCYKSCEKWELLFGEYHLHDKYGKPIRAAKKKEKTIAEESPVALVEEEQVETPQPMQAAVLPLPVQAVQQEKGLLPNPLLLLLLALLLLLLLVKRRARERQ